MGPVLKKIALEKAARQADVFLDQFSNWLATSGAGRSMDRNDVKPAYTL